VVVLDCSRSMFAETPSRLERARNALRDLAEALQPRGGHRLGLVTFAGAAKVACPLTHDYNLFRDAVEAVDLSHPDPALEPDAAASGTRIGLALEVAVEAHDERYRGLRDIVLLSDGDDPARDGEWERGAERARAEGVPVHCVGLGDPNETHRIPF